MLQLDELLKLPDEEPAAPPGFAATLRVRERIEKTAAAS